jgi:hypothetical protein
MHLRHTRSQRSDRVVVVPTLAIALLLISFLPALMLCIATPALTLTLILPYPKPNSRLKPNTGPHLTLTRPHGQGRTAFRLFTEQRIWVLSAENEGRSADDWMKVRHVCLCAFSTFFPLLVCLPDSD